MSFISELRNHLINDKQVDDLSSDKRFADLNFIGIKETKLTLYLVGFVKADQFKEEQISQLCDNFFKIIQLVSYDDFGLNPGLRNPNGLLCFVFEDYCPNSLLEFIKKQTRIAHWKRSAVIVSWVIDIKNKQVYAHNNPISIFPPVFIPEWFIFPNFKYLNSFVSSYSYSTNTNFNNEVEIILESIKHLEDKIETIYNLFKSIPKSQYKDYFPNTTIVTFIDRSDIYLNNSELRNLIMNKTGDTYNNYGQAGAFGKDSSSNNNTFFQSEQKPTLAEAAEEIQQLIKTLEKSNPTATEEEKIAYVNDETTPSFKRRVVSALQAGSEATIEEFLDNPYFNVGKAIVKGWIKPE